MDGTKTSGAEEKRRRLESALERGVVMIHLDARKPGVQVPPRYVEDLHLRLNVSYQYRPPDLTTDEWGVRETLSFGGQPFPVAVPWSAIFAITGATDENVMVFPEDMPRELFEAAARHFELTGEEVAQLREEASGKPLRPPAPARGFKPAVVEGGESSEPPPSSSGPEGGARRSHLRLVK